MIFKKIQRFPFASLQLFFFSSVRSPRLCVDRYTASKLLSNYFKWGKIDCAEKLFDKIPERNVVVWSIVIHGYAINGFHRKSMESFSRMRISRIPPNSFTFVGILVNISSLQNLVLGNYIHGLVMKTGLESDLIVATALLDTYAKCGNISDSRKLFEEMRNPGLVSCNAIIAGLINNELVEEAFILFNQVRRSGLVPNVATALTLTQGCISLELRTNCESIHGLIVKSGLDLDISVNNSVLDMYSRLMDIDAAMKVFDGMEVKDVISWSTMMGFLVKLEYASSALNLFKKMRDNEVNYDTLVIMNLISACAILGDLKTGKQIHGQVLVCGCGLELPLANSMIAMYSKCGDLDSSRAVFDQTSDKSLVSWTAIISGCVQNGRPREAMNLLIMSQQEEKFFVDSVLLVSGLTASAELCTLELCQQLHCHALKAGFLKIRSVQNSLISTYSKCGNVDFARVVFTEMGNLQDIVSWNAIINGYGINGRGETALVLYREMIDGGDYPDEATYLCILAACSHAGLVNDGLMVFHQMVKDSRVRPSQEHHGCVIDLLARAGCLSNASDLAIEFFEGSGLNAWRALLAGCVVHGNVELAELAVKKLSDRGIRDSGQLVLLSNVYSSAGRFKEAEELRLSMQKKGLTKDPGTSLLNLYEYG